MNFDCARGFIYKDEFLLILSPLQSCGLQMEFSLHTFHYIGIIWRYCDVVQKYRKHHHSKIGFSNRVVMNTSFESSFFLYKK